MGNWTMRLFFFGLILCTIALGSFEAQAINMTEGNVGSNIIVNSISISANGIPIYTSNGLPVVTPTAVVIAKTTTTILYDNIPQPTVLASAVPSPYKTALAALWLRLESYFARR